MFDKILWRFNGIILALACVGGLLFAVWAVFGLCQTFHTNPVEVVASTTKPKNKKLELHLHEFEQVPGTDYLVGALRSDDTGSYSSFSLSSSRSNWIARNYLFIDERDGTSHWLASGNNSWFLSHNELVEDPKAETERLKTVAIVYEMAPAKTSSGEDDEISQNAPRRILLYSLSTGAKQTLIENAKSLLSVKQVSKTKALIVFEAENKQYVLAIEPGTGKQIYKKEFPSP